MRHRIVAIALLSACIVWGMIACNDSGKPSPRHAMNQNSASPAPGPPQPHWILHQQLRSMADAMRGTLVNGAPADSNSPAGRAALATGGRAAIAANDLSESALRIPAILQGKPVSEADLRAFIAIAQTLHDQAHQLRGDAETVHVDQMQQTLGAMLRTCVSCHTRFHEFAGDLPQPTGAPTTPFPPAR